METVVSTSNSSLNSEVGDGFYKVKLIAHSRSCIPNGHCDDSSVLWHVSAAPLNYEQHLETRGAIPTVIASTDCSLPIPAKTSSPLTQFTDRALSYYIYFYFWAWICDLWLFLAFWVSLSAGDTDALQQSVVSIAWKPINNKDAWLTLLVYGLLFVKSPLTFASVLSQACCC